MSYKSSNNNGLKLTVEQQWKNASVMDTAVKLAGEEAKDRLYEPKHKKKLVRVLTVVAYMFFVSLAAIMLSLYYVFLWNGDQKVNAKFVTSGPQKNYQFQYFKNCETVLEEMQQQFTAQRTEILTSHFSTSSPPTSTTANHETATFPEEYDSLEELGKSSILVGKLMDVENYEEKWK